MVDGFRAVSVALKAEGGVATLKPVKVFVEWDVTCPELGVDGRVLLAGVFCELHEGSRRRGGIYGVNMVMSGRLAPRVRPDTLKAGFMVLFGGGEAVG